MEKLSGEGSRGLLIIAASSILTSLVEILINLTGFISWHGGLRIQLKYFTIVQSLKNNKLQNGQ